MSPFRYPDSNTCLSGVAKKAAEKVGRAGALEVILPLEDMVKEKQDSQLIIIGHSFGGCTDLFGVV